MGWVVPASPMLRAQGWPGGAARGGSVGSPPAPFLLSRLQRGKELPWGCGRPGWERRRRCLCVAELLLCAGIRHLWKGVGPAPGRLSPTAPTNTRHEGPGSGWGCPYQGLRLGLATRQVWRFPVALVGALGELRQFSIGWFLKRPKPAKPDVPEARQAGGII